MYMYFKRRLTMRHSKYLLIFLALFLSLAILAGCGNGPGKTPETSPATDKPAESGSTEPAPQTEPSDHDPSDEPWAGDLQESSIEETVLFDEQGVKITALELSFGSYAAELKLELENKTDIDWNISTGFLNYSGGTAVNGRMLDVYADFDIMAGKKSIESLRFSTDELALLGVTKMAEIELGFYIRDKDDRDSFFITGPLSLKTSAADHVQTQDAFRKTIVNKAAQELFEYKLIHFSEDEIFNEKGIHILSQALIHQDEDTLLLLEVENSADEHIYLAARSLFLNGLLVDDSTLTGQFINPGTRRLVALDLTARLSQDFADLYGVKEIGEILFSVTLEDGEHKDLMEPREVKVTVPGAKAVYDGSGKELFNQDGIRIIYKDLLPDPYDFIDDIHLLLLVENTGSTDYIFTDPYDALSVNDYMTDYYNMTLDIPKGGAAVIDIGIDYDSLEENGIYEISDIRLIEMVFKVMDNRYDVLSSPRITLTY